MRFLNSCKGVAVSVPFHQAVQAKGATLIKPLRDESWGMREFGVRTVANDEKNREYYHSIKSLAEFVKAKQAEKKEQKS